jgi:phytoene synthase
VTATVATTDPVAAAYARCDEITRAEAKNFAYGIRLLPPPKRQAMSAVYALARRIDDIGDGDLPADQKLAALDGVRIQVGTITDTHRSPDTDDPVLVALADAAARYPIPLAAFDDLIAGCEQDSRKDAYASIDETVEYCRLVAGSVGRLSLGIFGCADPASATPIADDLGVALQLTNILRDIVEDRDELGRIYLPADDIARFGCSPDLTGPDENVAALVLHVGTRAEEWYGRGLQLLPMLDGRSRACVAAMAGIYHRLLVRIMRSPTEVLHTRMSLPTWEKLYVAGRSLAGVSS